MTRIALIIACMALGFPCFAKEPKPILIASCAPPKGVNVAAETEKDRMDMPAEVFDSEAHAYISHPRNTSRWTFTVYQDGTAIEIDFMDDGNSTLNRFRAVGKPEQDAMSFVFDAVIGTTNVVTLYPKDATAIVASTGLLGVHKAIPTGAIYISRCEFSHVLN